jgi:hypothetical protein
LLIKGLYYFAFLPENTRDSEAKKQREDCSLNFFFRLFHCCPAKVISLNFSNRFCTRKKQIARKKLNFVRNEKIRAPKNSRSIIGKIQNSTKNYLTATAFGLRLFETKNYIYFLLKTAKREGAQREFSEKREKRETL